LRIPSREVSWRRSIQSLPMNVIKYQPFYTNSRALVIGVNAYKHVSALEIACADAESVAEILTGELGFSADKVTVLLDEQATRARIMEKFLAYDALAQDDRLIVFFAGHGETVSGQRGEVGYLVPVDGRLADKSTLIRWGELTSNSEIIPAKHILFLMDACYSGLAIQRGGKPGGQRFVSDMLQRLSRQVITAGKADEPVSDGGGPTGRNSVFTGHLLEGLRGKAADENGVLTATGLMSYVYHKVATDPQSHQTPHYGHLFGEGDFILRTPDNGHLSGSKAEDFLIEVLPERPEPPPSTSSVEVRPLFAVKNGYADPESTTFGQNEWTAKLGRIGITSGSLSEGSPATHWLALVAEPVSNQEIEFDLLALATGLRGESLQSEKPFEGFRFPTQSLTTANSVVFYDADYPGEQPVERWKRFIRLDQSGAIEYCEFEAVANTHQVGQTKENAGTPVKVYLYVQLIGIVWRFLFAAKRVLQRAHYDAGARFLVNLVGAKDSVLIQFAHGKGLEEKHWLDPFETGAVMGGSNRRCRDQHVQVEFRCALSSLGESESRKLIAKCAQQLGLAYNHQSAPRCFNHGTETFPWNEFNPNY